MKVTRAVLTRCGRANVNLSISCALTNQAERRFDVLLAVDSTMVRQENLAGFHLAVIPLLPGSHLAAWHLTASDHPQSASPWLSESSAVACRPGFRLYQRAAPPASPRPHSGEWRPGTSMNQT